MEMATTEQTSSQITLNSPALSDIDASSIFDQCIRRKNEILAFYNQYRNALYEKSVDPYLYYFDKEISPIIKHYLIFLRNTMLEIHKANIKRISESTSDQAWLDFASSTKTHIDSITDEFLSSIDSKWSWVQKVPNQNEIKLEAQLILSPGKIYAEQIEQCGMQMSRIKDQDIEVSVMAANINSIRADLYSHLKLYLDQEKVLEQKLSNLNTALSDPINVQKMLIETKDEIQGIPVSGQEEEKWIDRLDEKMSGLPILKLITDHSNGLLLEKTLDIAKGTKKWVDMVLLPQHIQLRDQVEQNLNRVCTMLINAQHKYQLLDGKKNKVYHDEIVKTIETLAERQKNTTLSISESYKDLLSIIDSKLRADQLYVDQNWMISTYDLTIGQLRSDTENVFKQVYDWIKNYISHASWIPFLNDDDQHQSEKTAQLVQNKKIPSQPGHYQRVFMSDGFLSDYYLVEREKEMRQVADLLDLWNDGFGASLIITGAPKCGKSTFGFQITEKYWPENTITLKANSVLTLKGKKINVQTDIADALENIIQTIKKKGKWCILIDEMNEWQNEKTSLFQNMQNLQRYVQELNPSIIIVAIMDYHLLSRLQTVMRFKDAFMSYMDLSFLDKKAFIKTLGHRHDATQIELLSPKGEQLTAKQIEGIGEKIWKYTSQNVGCSLNEWVRSVSQSDEGSWMINFDAYKYPLIVREKNAGIFNAILLYTSVTEEKLHKLTDHLDYSDQESIISNMLNTKVFIKDTNGKLQINEGVITELQYQYNDLDDYEHDRYVLESAELEGEKLDIQRRLQEYLFNYPFLSHETEVSMKERNGKFYVSLLTMEAPSSIIHYLNDMEPAFDFQFIKRVKL